MSVEGRLGGVEARRLLVRKDGQRGVLEGLALESIEPHVTISRVPGSSLAMAFVCGQVVPVLSLGSLRAHLLVGRVRGEVVAITGLEVIGFESSDVAAEPLPVFNVGQCLERLKTEDHSGQQFE